MLTIRMKPTYKNGTIIHVQSIFFSKFSTIATAANLIALFQFQSKGIVNIGQNCVLGALMA